MFQSSEKFFWYPIHTGDFAAKTAALGAEAIGCFVLLNNYLARHESLPNNTKQLQVICKFATESSVLEALGLFQQNNEGLYFSQEMVNYKKYSASKSSAKSKAGKKGANARWKKEKEKVG